MSAKKGKITIKPFRHVVQMDPNYAETTWRLLKSAIREIHTQNASGLSFEELYRNAYNMVLHKYGDYLYKGLKEEVNGHLQGVAERVAASNDDVFLGELKNAWDQHKTSMGMIRDILMYMDRVYVAHNDVPTVYEQGLMLFRDNVAAHRRIRPRLLQTLLAMVRREREGEVIDRSLFKSTTEMLIVLGVNSRAVYKEDFERHFLEESAQFYQVESQDFIGSNSCPDFLVKVEARLKEELARVQHYLDQSTEAKIREVVEHELIAKHMDTLVHMGSSGLIHMWVHDRYDDLNRMYRLFSRVPNGLNTMRDVISQHVRETGRALCVRVGNIKESGKGAGSRAGSSSASASAGRGGGGGSSSSAAAAAVASGKVDPNEFVQSLLDIKDKYDKLLGRALSGDKVFSQAINQAFEYFINLTSQAPEYLSLFIDEKLRRGLKGLSEEEVDSVLDKVMVLFRFLSDKDIFERYYKQHLAKRLLMNRSVSDDAERNMISKLKTEVGFQFTSKLEGMFTDMKVSADTMDAFKAHVRALDPNPLGRIDLSVNVLTTGFWPTQTTQKCNLPPEIANCCEVFKKFYLGKHSGRRLAWQSNMGQAELKTQFGSKRHDLIVSTYQMCILLQFNDRPTLTYKELREATEIAAPELKRNLLSMSLAKTKVLTKSPPTPKMADTDVYAFNTKFRSKLIRVKVSTVSLKETATQRKETRERADDDRRHQIEAAIVRVMKARRTMEHSQLIAEVTRQLSARFMPEPAAIKKRIESLIEREYLERAPGNRRVFNYLA